MSVLDVTFPILVCIGMVFCHIEMYLPDFFLFCLFVPIQDIKQGMNFAGNQLYFAGNQLFIDDGREVLPISLEIT